MGEAISNAFAYMLPAMLKSLEKSKVPYYHILGAVPRRRQTPIELLAAEVERAVVTMEQILGVTKEINDIREKRKDIATSFLNIWDGRLKSKSRLRDAFLSSIVSAGVGISKDHADMLFELIYDDLVRTIIAWPAFVESFGLDKPKMFTENLEFSEGLKTVKNILAKKRIDEIPGPFAKTVFVGGDYDDMPTLRKIESYVTECNHVPVVAIDYEIPTENSTQLMDIHDMDILLVHNCRHAIFEVTRPAGQYNEIEWALRMFLKPSLALCKTRAHGVEKPDLVSTMDRDLFRKHNQPIRYYADFEELKKIIQDFLSGTT